MSKPVMIDLETARWRLGTVWFLGSAIIALLLIVQSLAGVYEERVQGVWGWALPNFLPTLMLMLGVFAGAALAEETETDAMKVRSAFFKLAVGLSVFHLVCILVTLGMQPFIPSLTNATAPNQMSVFEMSNLWLGPLQGLVAAAIGALFFSKATAKEPIAPGGLGTGATGNSNVNP